MSRAVPNVIGSIPPGASTSAAVMFHHPDGHADVSSRFVQLLDEATVSLQAAVCFVTQPGARILLRCSASLRLTNSFFVGSIEPPSDLDAFLALHKAAPGHVYIHMGGRTPEAIDVGRSLMHSKVVLAEGNSQCRLWVGSHNLTAAALAGGNFEAGIELLASPQSSVIQDARQHLQNCRMTAEPFDPGQMERYREIQKRRLPLPPWIDRQHLLVIHAEAEVWPSMDRFTVHLLLAPSQFDQYFIVDRPVRLFLHPKGTLSSYRRVDYSQARLWEGAITGVVRTERHPGNRGVQGRFDTADYEIEIADVVSAPRFMPMGSSTITPTSQVVMRVTREMKPGDEVYSTASESPMKADYVADEAGQKMHEVDEELAGYFTTESVHHGVLIFRQVHGVAPKYSVEGYEPTMRVAQNEMPLLHTHVTDEKRGLPEEISYYAKQPRFPLDSFFYVTHYVIREKDRAHERPERGHERGLPGSDEPS